MDKLKVTAYLKTPLMTNGGGYMTLDALLASVLFDECGDVELAHSSIPIKETNGLYHASAAHYTVLEQTKINLVASLRATHDIDTDLILKKKKVNELHCNIASSNFGNVLNSYKVLDIQKIDWFVEGDYDKIKELTKQIDFIGRKRTAGYGEIKGEIEITQSDCNGLLDKNGFPLRPIPIDLFQGNKSAIKADVGWKPAYWDIKNRMACYVPKKENLQCL